MTESTKRIDDCECIYCHHIFNGRNACNGNMNAETVICPCCGKEMEVRLSIEYLCCEIEA